MSEFRKDLLMNQWVIVADERRGRPNDYVVKSTGQSTAGATCPFCPGNEDKTPPEVMARRLMGSRPNGSGWQFRVVPNKFPALGPGSKLGQQKESIYQKKDGIGVHEVIIETPNHHQIFQEMSDDRVTETLKIYQDRIRYHKNDKRLRYISLFRNYGVQGGASLMHPHSQLMGVPLVPPKVLDEIRRAKVFYREKNQCLSCEMIKTEVHLGKRVVAESDSYLCVAPYGGSFPFEVWILPKDHQSNFEVTPETKLTDLSGMIKSILKKQVLILNNPSYNFYIQSAPFQYHNLRRHDAYYHWQIRIIPRWVHWAGFELASGICINPVPPEETALCFRQVE